MHLYRTGQAYEVEFFTLDGSMVDVITVEAAQVRPVSSTDILHARAIQ